MNPRVRVPHRASGDATSLSKKDRVASPFFRFCLIQGLRILQKVVRVVLHHQLLRQVLRVLLVLLQKKKKALKLPVGVEAADVGVSNLKPSHPTPYRNSLSPETKS